MFEASDEARQVEGSEIGGVSGSWVSGEGHREAAELLKGRRRPSCFLVDLGFRLPGISLFVMARERRRGREGSWAFTSCGLPICSPRWCCRLSVRPLCSLSKCSAVVSG